MRRDAAGAPVWAQPGATAADPMRAGQRNLVAWVLLSPVPVLVCLTLYRALWDVADPGLSPLSAALLAVLPLAMVPVSIVSAWRVHRRAPVGEVALFFLGSTFAAIALGAYLRGGISSSSLPWLLVITTGAMLATGKQIGAISIGLAIALVAGFGVLEATSLSYAPRLSQDELTTRAVADLIAISILLFTEVAVFEESKRRALDRLRRANADLATARDLADSANRSKSALLANVSHEIRSPMTAILGFADLVRERSRFVASDSEARSALETVRRNGLHLLDIINDILDISKIEAGCLELDPVVFSPADLAEEVVELMRVRAEAAGIELRVELAETLPAHVRGDRKRIKQVLLNLVGNAIKFTHEGSVRVRAEPDATGDGHALCFSVEDDGIGMDADQLRGLFQPFSQADASTARIYGGTGLGLAICKRLIDLMRGRIHVRSEVGHGSTFVVGLPTQAPPADGCAAPARTRPDAPPRAADRAPLRGRVLVVDDLEDNRHLLLALLRSETLHVDVATSGRHALELVANPDVPAPDLILMDLHMPGMDGFETRAALRSRGYRGAIVALTAHALASERVRCDAAGFDAYLTKPIERAQLFATLERLLTGSGASSDPASSALPATGDAAPTGAGAEGAPAGHPRSLAEAWLRIRELFIPDRVREDPAELARARFIVSFCLLPLPLVPAWALLAPHLVQASFGATLSLMILFLAPFLLAIPIRLKEGRRIDVAVHLLMSYACAMFGLLAWITAGLISPAIYWILVPPVVAVATLGVRSGLVWAAVTCAYLAGLYALHRTGAAFPDMMAAGKATLTASLNLASVILLVGSFGALYQRTSTHALESLRSTNTHLGRARDQANLANQAKSEFIANISHELRTPMTAILGFTEVLLERWPCGAAERPALEWLQTIRRNGVHLLHIINDILDLSKIEAGRLEIARDAVDPLEIAREVFELMQVRADEKELELALETETALPARIPGDALRIRQILVNLLGNAIKFTERGRVCLAVAMRVDGPLAYVRFCVHDTGPGIRASELALLFEPFQQANAEIAREYGGTGLGLAICKRLSELMGADIYATSREGEGSTFALELPVGRVDALRMRDPAPPAPPSPAEPPALENTALEARVLLVDDSEDNRRLITWILRRHGTEVVTAADGDAALDLVEQATLSHEPYDLILMDLQMPVRDGYAAIRELRERGIQTPIVALSAHAMAEARERAFAAGADRYATKPIARAELVPMLRELLSGSSA